LHVLDLAAKRSLIVIGQEMVNTAFEPSVGMEWPELAAKARHRIEEMEKHAVTSVGWKNINQVLEDIARRIEAPPRHVSTGIPLLDEDLGGGFLGGRVYALEAPRKSFKTGFVATIVRHFLRVGVPFLYVMADRTVEEAIGRIAAYDLGTNSTAFDGGSDPATAAKVRGLLYSDRAMIAQEPSIRFSRLQALCGHAVQLGMVGVVLDYLQLVQAEDGPKDNKAAALGRVAEWVKGFCIEHDIWALLVSQENRQGETLWSGELERACVWMGKIKQVEIMHGWRPKQALYLDIPFRTHGQGKYIGTEEQPAWEISETGPLLTRWVPI
jgi:replicative DNA helicase